VESCYTLLIDGKSFEPIKTMFYLVSCSNKVVRKPTTHINNSRCGQIPSCALKAFAALLSDKL
jgi:hypothetical protein